jgi:hypothetical protein
MSLRFSCPSCGSAIVGKASHAGKTLPCPKCKSSITVPGGEDVTSPSVTTTRDPVQAREPVPATQKQRDFATSLGIKFSDDIDKESLSNLIDEAVIKRDDERYDRIAEMEDRESKVRREIRAEVEAQVIAEHDADFPRLDTATEEQILESLANRNVGAILITFPYGEIEDVDELESVAGIDFRLNRTDDIDNDIMKKLVLLLGMKLHA